jgi:hypothetical protein
VWYYDELARAFRAAGTNELVEEFALVVEEMKRATGYQRSIPSSQIPRQEQF